MDMTTNPDYMAGYYYVCGRNDAGRYYVDPAAFAEAYAQRRSDHTRSAPSVQDFYRDFLR